jgi:hypothetical protein
MKNISKVLVALAITASATSCDSFLDVNQNPNNILTATPQAILGQALKVTGDNVGNLFNTYGAWTAGYWAQTGTVNGYNEERTYNYNSLYQQNLWSSTYDNLLDYDLIEKAAVTSGAANLQAIAKIMKVYNFQLLVDQYGDIPYSEALQGSSLLISPKYDKAEDIYKDLNVKLDESIALIKGLSTANTTVAEDIVFNGNMTNWLRFANTLKLRLLLRQSFVPSLDGYVKAEMTKIQTANNGFLTVDANVQPGYMQVAGQQNPFYNRYRITAAGAGAGERLYQAPTQYVLDELSQTKDPRLNRLYVRPTTGPKANTFVGTVLGVVSTQRLPGAQNTLPRPFGGIFKGYDAPTPIMLAAESYFLQSEAKSRGYLTGGDAAAKTDFNNGITASFTYFYTPAPSQRGSVNDSLAYVTRPIYTPTAEDLATLTPDELTTKIRVESGRVAKYFAANPTNPKVNWDAPGLTKLEKIIYQKYFAMQLVTSHEGWNEYRRTGFPKFPASLESTSPRADKLPVRLLYPQTEIATNSANIPTGISQFTSKIFWDVVD